MKIVAQIPKDAYLVKLTKQELAHVMGHYSSYGSDFHKKIDEIIGKELEINVSDIYSKHSSIVSFQDSRNLKKARKELEDLLESLTPIEEAVEKLSKIIEKSSE